MTQTSYMYSVRNYVRWMPNAERFRIRHRLALYNLVLWEGLTMVSM